MSGLCVCVSVCLSVCLSESLTTQAFGYCLRTLASNQLCFRFCFPSKMKMLDLSPQHKQQDSGLAFQSLLTQNYYVQDNHERVRFCF